MCAVALSAIICSCGNKGYVISGNIIDLDEGNINLLDIYGHVVSSDEVRDGKFEFRGKVDVPCLVYINNALGVTYPIDIPVLLENTRIKVTGDARISHIDITGTKANENMVKFKVSKDKLAPSDTEGMLRLVKETFEENSDNVLGAMLISNLYNLVSDRELIGYCDRLPEEFRSEHVVAHYRDVCQARVDTEPGRPFVDFMMEDPDGKEVRLSDVVPGNEATVLLFWASWGREVSEIIPALTSACRKYQSHGLDMFNVSLDSNMEKMAACVKEFGLFGRLFSNGPDKGDEAASLYGIEGLPRVVLIRRDGTIAARGRSYDDISEALRSIFEQ